MTAPDEDAFWLHAQTRVTIVELAQSSGLGEAVLHELVEYGAITPSDAAQPWSFSSRCVLRLRTAARLQRDLELETPTLALVLSFLERIEGLEDEVRDLIAQLGAARLKR